MNSTATNAKRLIKGLISAAIVVAVLVSGYSVAAGNSGKNRPTAPTAKRTQVIRAEIYKSMEASQKAYEAKDYTGAVAALDSLKEKESKLNDYERATLYNLYAAIYYAQGNNAKAIESYNQVLKQPNLPDGLRDSSMYALAQLYFLAENYPQSIQILKQWLAVITDPSPEGNALLAQAYYQTQDYPEAEKALITSIKISRDKGQVPKEGALALLRAIYYERKQYDKTAKVLEILVGIRPDNSSYWQQLAGMYGLLDRQNDQTDVMHVAYSAKLLNNENDILNVARLYMIAEAPYPAARVLADGMRNKLVKLNVENLQLYAQALAMSKEFKQQVPVLKKLAEMSGDAKHYVFLGQAYSELNDWDNAVAAFKAATKAKNVIKPDELQMQLGTALFNDNKLNEARDAFVSASRSPSLKEQTTNWIKFVNLEIERREALQR